MNYEAYALGATLYMPIIHDKVVEIVSGTRRAPASSIILCLEDALAERDVSAGLERLRWVIERYDAATADHLFIRPRSFEMAQEIAQIPGVTKFAGMVAPKVTPANADVWLTLASESRIPIMPTLESADYFDPAGIIAVRDVFDRFDPACIKTVRIGGNDLLGAMALRRERGLTAWEGPLAWVLAMLSSLLISKGYAVAAPVFDIIDDLATLEREVERDVAAGFTSKTAIHPSQTETIEAALRVDQADLERARRVLADDARAVFQVAGTMCEPMTHRAWAERIQARARLCGVCDAPIAHDLAAMRK